MCVCTCECGGWGTNFRSQLLFFSPMWILGIKFRSLALVEGRGLFYESMPDLTSLRTWTKLCVYLLLLKFICALSLFECFKLK